MRGLLLLVFGLLVLLFGCLQPYSEGVNLTKKSGCAYGDPPCSANYSCINNTCILKSGCAYNNPACSENETCLNNTCALKPGCAYNNPSCGADYECKNNSCIEKIICGKFGCQAGEGSTCCIDCGCPNGEVCSSGGTCLVNGSEIEVVDFKINDIPSTILYSTPPRTIEVYTDPQAQITLKNRGTLRAFNVKVRSTILGHSGSVIKEIGTLSTNENITINITQPLTKSVLDLTNDTKTKMKLTIEYQSLGEPYTKIVSKELTLSDRNAFDWNIPVAASTWVNPQEQSIIYFADDATLKSQIIDDLDRERAARQVYNHLQAYGLALNESEPCYSDSLAFTTETLASKSGDCGDVSVLYASLIEAAGLKSVIIKNNETILCGYQKLDGSIVPIDLRGINSDDFKTAKSSGSSQFNKSSEYFFPRDYWGVDSINILTNDIVLGPDIKATSQNCAFFNNQLNVHYWFENKGYDSGRRCLKAVLYDGDSVHFSERVCVDVPKFEKRNVTFQYTAPKRMLLTEKCWID
jgi:hypothetical protein